MSSFQLPAPSPDERDHSARLQQAVCEASAECGGCLGFDRYMEMALYGPGLGYYTAGRRKFGQEGDFITAPEISPLFARCIAHALRPVLRACDAPDVVEFGAGSGKLACELLRALQALDALPERYLIMELSPELRARQQALVQEQLPALSERVEWLDRLPEAGIEGAVVANEVLDAMPVHRFRMVESGLEEQCVACQGEELHPGWMPASRQLQEAVERLGLQLPSGYVSEINLRLQPWIGELGRLISSGAALLIDYGYERRDYYNPDRNSGTLLCHYRHHANTDPLYLPGMQDITAHVDFTAVAEAADRAGLAVSGYTSQAAFLLGCGIEQMLEGMAQNQNSEWFALVEGVKRLVLPTEMGERFRVMALTKGLQTAPEGFAQDMRFRL
ncbi:MAG: SAM-dependent methyltransferase [Gammaproteobacteria bacterium]|jgi:SAM-dependent MidA family methyltransferase